MARKSREELSDICVKYGVPTLYSWSRYNSYKGDKYGYYLNYVKKAKKDRANTGIYGISGNKAHDIVEDFYLDKLNHQEMLDEYESALMEFDFAGLKYNRTDEERNASTANKYESCLRHFFLHHDRIPHKLFLERFITIKVGKYRFQGYIDAFHQEERDGEKHIIVTDWKTSSMYRGAKIEQEMGQLVLYAQGMHQITGVPIENIVGRWNFLKYVEIEYTLAKGDKRTRIVERNAIGKALKSNSSMWLRKEGYDKEEIADFMEEMIGNDDDHTNNSIEVLPQAVQDKFVFRDCYVDIPLTQEVVDDLMEEIESTIDEIVEKTAEYEKASKEDKEEVGDELFWEDVTNHSSFFMANLSDYSPKLHKPYAKFLDDLKLFNTDKKKKDTSDDDLDWLFD